MPAVTVIKHRRGTAAQWTSANTILAAGEIGFETDTNMFKLGDGTTAWTSLAYAAITTAAGDTRYVLASTRGAASGVATLDSTGKLPASQLPATGKLVNVATVANQAARLALAVDDDAQFVVQTDTAQAYLLPAGANPATAGNWVQLPQPSLAGLEQTANKDAANGYAGLDSSGKIKTAELPTLDGGTP